MCLVVTGASLTADMCAPGWGPLAGHTQLKALSTSVLLVINFIRGLYATGTRTILVYTPGRVWPVNLAKLQASALLVTESSELPEQEGCLQLMCLLQGGSFQGRSGQGIRRTSEASAVPPEPQLRSAGPQRKHASGCR